MKAIKYLTLMFFAVLLLVILYYFYPRKVTLFSESKILLSKEKVKSFIWVPIDDKKHKLFWEAELGCVLPEVNFNRNYLYLSRGRRINKIRYSLISKYLWDYNNTYAGDVDFADDYENNAIYVYKTDTILCKQKYD